MAVSDDVPKSRITLTYRTDVNGEKETVALPLRLLLMGDFSKGASTDRKVDLDERGIRNLDGTNLSGIMKDMGMDLSFSVPNKIDPDNSAELEVNLKLDSMDAFGPGSVAESIPKVKGLLVLKKLLLEVQANLDNRKAFRQLIAKVAKDENAIKALAEELKGFESFKVPTAAAAAADAGAEDAN